MEAAMTNIDLHWPIGALLLHSWDDRFEVFLVLRYIDSVCLTAYQMLVKAAENAS